MLANIASSDLEEVYVSLVLFNVRKLGLHAKITFQPAVFMSI